MSRAGPHPAGVLHRPADPAAPGQPAHRSPPTATPSDCCCVSPQKRTGKPPSALDIADLDAPLIGAFLDHLEPSRGNSVRTRNARLAAIHSLFRFAALRHPEHAAASRGCWRSRPSASTRPLCHLPHRRRDRRAAGRPGPGTWTGRRDHALLAAGRPDRAARLRADRADLRRRPPRHRGAIARLFTGVRAPSTLGTFLRRFTFGHVRQLDAVAAGLLARLAAATPLLPGADQIAFVDIDDTVRQTYGYAKQGAGRGYTGVEGVERVARRALHPDLSTGDRRDPAPVRALGSIYSCHYRACRLPAGVAVTV